MLASAPRLDELTKWLRGRLFERTWEEQFGPLEGLPPVCAEIANVPSVAERAAALRRLFADQMSEAIAATAGDLAAARLLLPELRTALRPRWVERCPVVLGCLRRLGTDAKELLPDVEALAPIPWLHFEVEATARILRGEVEPERAAQRPTERPTGPSTPGPGFRNGWPGPRYR